MKQINETILNDVRNAMKAGYSIQWIENAHNVELKETAKNVWMIYHIKTQSYGKFDLIYQEFSTK